MRDLELAPRHASSYYTRACAHALSGQPELALDDIRRALECDPALCTELRADADFVSLRADSRFIALLDPWPSDAELLIDHELVRALRASGWRLDPSDIEIRTPSSLAQRVAGGLLIVGQQRDEVYVNFRPRGQGEEGEWWLYTKPGEHGRAVGELIASWQNELTHRNFREFVVSVKKVVHSKVEWHRGHP